MSVFSVGIHFISGMMVGIEFVSASQNDGVACFVLDLFIVRLMFQWEEVEE